MASKYDFCRREVRKVSGRCRRHTTSSDWTSSFVMVLPRIFGVTATSSSEEGETSRERIKSS